jgi:hypothetical protein
LDPYSEPDFVKVDEIEALPQETLFEAVEKIEEENTASVRSPKLLNQNSFIE